MVRNLFRDARQLVLPPEWLKRRRQVDRDFDRKHGVNTGGTTHLKGIVDSPNWREGVSHIAVDPDEFAAGIAALDLGLSDFTFIDVGSGKGRALMLASEYPFRRIVGIEFAKPLVEIARANLRGTNVEIVHADATDYEFPAEPTVLFLYNPFGRPVMDKVAKRVSRSLEMSPRELTVLYLNPFHGEAWTEAGFKEVARGGHFAAYQFVKSVVMV